MIDPLQRWRHPTAVGSSDITALVAERIVREILTGLALRRRRSLLD